MPCNCPRSPLVTPDVRISRIRRSQIPLAAGIRKEVTVPLHRQQPQIEQLTIPGGSLRRAEGPLAPPAQMPDQTLADIPADLAERLPWVAQLEVLPPALQVSVDLADENADRLEAHGGTRPLPQLLPFSCQRFHRRLQPPITNATAKLVAFVAELIAQEVQTGSLFVEV